MKIFLAMFCAVLYFLPAVRVGILNSVLSIPVSSILTSPHLKDILIMAHASILLIVYKINPIM